MIFFTLTWDPMKIGREEYHGGPSEAGDCSHPPPKMATAENPTSGKDTFDNVMGRRSLRFFGMRLGIGYS